MRVEINVFKNFFYVLLGEILIKGVLLKIFLNTYVMMSLTMTRKSGNTNYIIFFKRLEMLKYFVIVVVVMIMCV